MYKRTKLNRIYSALKYATLHLVLYMLTSIAVVAQEREAHLFAFQKDSVLLKEQKRLDSLIDKFYGKDYDSLVKYSELALQIAKLRKDTFDIAKSYHYIGLAYEGKNEKEQAVANLLDATKNYKLIKDTINQAITLNGIALIYENSNNYKEALKIYLEGINLIKNKETDLISYSLYNNISNLYSSFGHVKKAKEYLEEAICIGNSIKDSPGLSIAPNLNLGNIALDEKNYDDALRYYLEALEIADSLKHNTRIAQAKSNVSYAYYLKKEYDKGVKYAQEAINLYKELSVEPFYGISTLHTLGVSYIGSKQYGKAENILKECLSSSKENKFMLGLEVCNQAMYELRQKQKRFDDALFYYKEYIRYKDSVINIETVKELNAIESEKLLTEKNQEISELSEEKAKSEISIKKEYSVYIGIVVIIAMLLLIGFWLNTLRNRALIAENKQKLVESELHALRNQMNPHFIFNTLNGVQNYILKSDTYEAYNYLIKFSESIRLILENSKESFIELYKEMELIRIYVDLEKLRFRDKIEYLEDVNFEIPERGIRIPAMILQPIVENAIIHGILNRKNGGKVTVTLDKNIIRNSLDEEYFITCIVEDNGVGRQASSTVKQHEKNKHLSLATTNTKQRVKILKENGYSNIDYKIEDLYGPNKEGLGTRVILQLPIQKENDTKNENFAY